MSMFSNDMRVANTASPSFEHQANVGQYGWTGADQGHYNQLIQYVDECRKIWEDLQEKILYIEDLLVQVGNIDAQVKYVEQMTNAVIEAKDQTFGYLTTVTGMYDEVKPLYGDFTLHYADFNTKYTNFLGEYPKTLEAAANAKVSETNAAQSAQDAAELVEELRKGQVYRGTWNIEKNASYPPKPDTNSVWDVVLNEGSIEFRFDNTLWYWGDRLLFLKDDNKFTQIEAGGSVTSVNGKKGAVTITAADTGALPLEGGKITGHIVLTDAKTTIRNASGTELLRASNESTVVGNYGGRSYLNSKDNPVIRVGGSSTEYKIYHEGNKPAVSDVIGALQRVDYGIGAKQGDSNDASNYTEDGSSDFNKLLTSGVYTASGNWLNSMDNKPTAQAVTCTIEVIARAFGAGPAYFQRLYMRTADASSRYSERTGTGTYPNITWSRWAESGTYQSNLQYRMTIERPGVSSYPYITTSKPDLKTDVSATGTYAVGNIQFKSGPKTDDNNPDSGKRAAIIQANLFGNNESGELYMASHKFDEGNAANCIARLRHDGFWATHAGKTMKWASGNLELDGNKVYHEGYKPTATDVGVTNVGMGGVSININELGITDLNKITTSGHYYTSNASDLNRPSNAAGPIVHVHGGTGAGYQQYVRDNNLMFRGFTGTTFQPWQRVYHTGYKPTAADVGALPIKDYYYGEEFVGGTCPANGTLNLTPQTDSILKGITRNSNEFTVSKAGFYKLSYGFQLEPTSGNQQVTSEILIGSTTIVGPYCYMPGTPTAVMSTTAHTIVRRIEAGGKIYFRIKSANNSTGKLWPKGYITIEEI